MRRFARISASLLLLAAACAKPLTAPTAVAKASSDKVAVGAVVGLTGKDSADTNSPPLPLFFRWALLEIPAGSHAALNDPALVSPSFVADVAGDYTVSLVVQSGQLASEASVVKVTAGPCGANAPSIATVASTPEKPASGQAVLLSAEVSDADNATECGLTQELAYRWSLLALPAGSAAKLNLPSARTPSFTVDVLGDYTVQLVTIDSTGRESAPKTLTIAAQTCGSNAPSVEAPVASPAAPGLGQIVQLSAAVTDADNATECGGAQTFAFHWAFVSMPAGSAARLNDASIDKPSFVPDVPGDYVVRATVDDGTGRKAISAATVVTATGCGGGRPMIESATATPAAPNAGQVVQLDAMVKDADADAPCNQPQTMRRSWRIVSLPSGSTARINDAGADNPSFVADLPGRYAIELVVTDQTGLASVPRLVELTASACGSAVPTLANAAAAPAAPNVGQVVQLSAKVSDADGDTGCDLPQTFSYAWRLVALPAGSHAALNAPSAVNPSFVVDVPGTYAATLVVTDGTGRASAPARVEMTVGSCTTAAPVVAAATATPAAPTVGAAVQLAADVTDADADAPCSVPQSYSYAWRIVSLPSGSRASLNDAGARNPSFVVDVPGTYAASVVVTDATGRASAPQQVEITVGVCTTASPVVKSVSSTPEAPNAGAAVQLAAEIEDADAAEPCSVPQSFSYAWRLLALPVGSHAVLNAPSAVNPSFVADVPGTYTAALMVTDATGRQSAWRKLEITAGTCTTAAPVVSSVTATPSAPTVGAAVQLAGEVADADADEPCSVPQTFSYAWRLTALPVGSRASLNASSSLRPSFVVDVPGTYVAALVVTDGTGRASEAKSVEMTVGACTTASPVVSAATAAPSAPNVGDFVQLSSTVEDGDAAAPCSVPQSFRYAWWLVSLPSGSRATLNDAGARNPSFRADIAGTYTAQVVVTDQTGRSSAQALVELTVAACGGAAPAIESATATPSSPDVGQVVRFSAVVSDADAGGTCNKPQNLRSSWRLVGLPAGSRAALNDAGAESPSIVADVPGSYVAELVVTDQAGLRSEPKTITVVATACGSAMPVATVTAPASAAIGGLVSLTASVTDADTQAGCGRSAAVRYAWAFDSVPAGSMAVLNDAGVASPSFVADRAGTYRVRLVVTDAEGHASLAATGETTVSGCGGNAPSATLEASPTAPGVGTLVQLSSVVTDADTEAPCTGTETFSYAWSFVSVPAGSHAALAQATLASPTFVPDVAGQYALSLDVTDAAGHTTRGTRITVTVAACGAAAPVAAIAASTTAPAIGQPVLLTASATDADTLPACGALQTMTWAWSFDALPAGSGATLNQPAATAPSFVPDVPGDYVVALVATDSTGRASARVTTRITASSCGTALPVVAVTASTSAPSVRQPVLLTATVTDDDNLAACSAGQTVSLAWAFDALPAGSVATLNAPAASSPSFVPDLPGVYVVTATPTDSTGRRGAPQSLTVTASSCGAAVPSVTATVSEESPYAGQTVGLAALGVDADNDAPCSAGQTVRYAWSLVALPSGSTAALFAADSATPSFVADVAGDYLAQVVATDSSGRASAPATVTITADACGSNAPTATIAQSPASVGTGMSVNLVPTVTDADNDAACQALASAPAVQTFTHAWTILSAPTGSTTRLVSSTARDAGFLADAAGAYLVRLVVTDSTGRASAPVDFTVTANACGSNTPVVSAATASSTTPNVGQVVSLSATFDDTDNAAACQAILGRLQTFDFGWSITSAPAGSAARVLQAATLGASFSPDVAGAYVLAFTAADETGRLATRTVSLTAGSCGSNTPTVSVTGGGSTNVGGVVTFAANVTDADNAAPCSAGQTVTSYRWSLVEAPAGSRASLLQGVQATSFVADVAGTYTATVVATDSTGRSSDAGRASVTVRNCGGNAPVAVATTGGNVAVGADASFDGTTSTDADNVAPCSLGQALSYQWELFSVPAGSSATLKPVSTVATPSLRPDRAGTYVVRLRVTDSTGLTSAVVTQSVTAN